MKGYLKIFIVLFLISIFAVQCSRKGKIITEPRFGIYNFTTYTVDTFRFRIIFNGEVLTDSLLSPVGFFSRSVSFFDTNGTLQIIDAGNNNQLVLDTVLTMQTGINYFSLVQLLKGQKPFVPALPANEPPPAAGKYKVRFQYTTFVGETGFPPQNFFYDSVMCYVRRNGIPIDTVVLKKYDLSPFYEAGIGGAATFSLAIRNAVNGALIDASTSPSVGSSYTGFNTVSVSGRTISDWVLLRMY